LDNSIIDLFERVKEECEEKGGLFSGTNCYLDKGEDEPIN
jgi:hypothetical protein